MNVKTKLLVSQTLNAVLVIGVAAIAVVVAQRFNYQVERVEAAYDQRQTITMLAVQTFHYKTAIDKFMAGGPDNGREIERSRSDVEITLKELSRQTEQELSFVGVEDRMQEADESERVGQLRTGLAEIHHMVKRIVELHADGRLDQAQQLYEQVEHWFVDELSIILAKAMADEDEEVRQADSKIADLAAGRIAFLYGTGACALQQHISSDEAAPRRCQRAARRRPEVPRAGPWDR
jgi:hypothetical protein